MPQMRIAVISFDYYPFHPRLRNLAEATVELGYVVDVICLRHQNAEPFEIYNGVNVYRVPLKRNWDGSLPIKILSWCWFLLLAGILLTRLHIKRPYKIIHVHNMPDFLVFSALFPKLLKAKVILDVQDASPELMAEKVKGRLRGITVFLAILQERLSTAFADHVITTGWTFEQLLLKRGVLKENLTIILNSTDPKLFPPSRRSHLAHESDERPRPFILMYHGTVEERQGLDIAVHALALASHTVPRLQLHIKGVGSQLPMIRKLAIELGVSDQVIMSDICPIGEVVDFVAFGDIGIIPYRSDGFMELVLPVKVFEFAWMHRPIIASNILGIRSLFRPESIVLCDSTKPESFAEAIIDLYKHPEKYTSLVANAAEDYTSYRWEVQLKRYQQLLASLCSKGSQRRYTALHSEL